MGDLSINEPEEYDQPSERIDNGLPGSELRADMWDLMVNKGLLQDDTTQWLKLFEKGAGANVQIKRTYRKMRNVTVDEMAPVPDVRDMRMCR